MKRLKKCKYFRDVTYSIIGYPDNTTQQVMHCRCPRNAVVYLHKTEAFQAPDGGEGQQFNFVCSPPHVSELCQLASLREATKTNCSRELVSWIRKCCICKTSYHMGL